MRTARLVPYGEGGGLPDRLPWTQTPQTPPWTNKYIWNITFPQLSLRAVTNLSNQDLPLACDT